ncbi:MAG: GAF domain-containing protein [Actinomycetota bacterium]|nr:GAF domain-containing protein [Actinomycetota bacterium]
MSTSDDELMQRLEQIYAKGSATPVDHAAAFVAEELERIGADAGFVATISTDGRAIDVARVTRFSENPVRLGFPVDAPYPIAEVLRGGGALFIASNEQLRCNHPGLTRVDEDDHACATVPLRDDAGEIVGALNLGFEDPREFPDVERAAIQELAERCARVLRAADVP